MTDTLMEKIREFAMLGAAYAGTARLTSWSESPKGMGFSLRIDDKDDNGEPLVHTHPFKGFPIGKDGQRIAIVAILLGDPVAANGVDAPFTEGEPKGSPAQQPETKSWKDLSYPQRAGIRCSDPQYTMFIAASSKGIFFTGFPDESPKDATARTLRKLCGVESRSEIQPGTMAASIFDSLEQEFSFWQHEQNYPASDSAFGDNPARPSQTGDTRGSL